MEFNMFIIFYVVLSLFAYNISCANVYRSASVISNEYDSSRLLPHYSNTLKESDNISSNSYKVMNKSRRVKRSVMTSGKCAIGYAWCFVKCCTCDEYEEITGRSC